jgi:hypothetical protein
MNDWTAFGRVDADGTVYVKTAEGERVVGSWQAGTPEEGLAHFARRFADLVTEVDLIEARLASGAADASHSMGSIKRIRGTLDDAHVVGDIDGLATRLDRLAGVAEEKAGEARAARELARTEALARKTALVEEAEKIAAESTGWKSAGDRLKEILDEWKTIRGVDKKSDGELWKRFAAARDGFTRRRGAHFATLDGQRKQAQTAKEELVKEAESLADSTEWAATATRLKELMNEWKAAPRAAKEAEQRLWEGSGPRRTGSSPAGVRSSPPGTPNTRATSTASRPSWPRSRRWTWRRTRGRRRTSCAMPRRRGTTPAGFRGRRPGA